MDVSKFRRSARTTASIHARKRTQARMDQGVQWSDTGALARAGRVHQIL